MPWRRYCVRVLSAVTPTHRPVAMTASQSSMSLISSSSGRLPAGQSSGVGTDGEAAVGEGGQPEQPASRQRIVRGQRAVARLQADDGAVEAAGIDAVRARRGAHDGDVAGAFGEPTGRGVRPDQVQ